ncbi:single-stranded DNA-binding protein [Limnohabitans sp. DM1]|uniref:single-stranded DNA-binding protein n=1 Tax=Limnohabitans sp. DM1 TaxID=1597955 RepID=UPI000AF34066|nr:single-stranded DNA-binding protein [Limnohabitans sp. DM1]
MATESILTGNLLADPAVKQIKVRGEDRVICEMRIMSDVWREDHEGNLVQDPDKSQPAQITVWNERLAEGCGNLLRKGMRVVVMGQSYPHIYRVSDADRAQGKSDSFEIRVDATSVSLALNRVEQIVMKARRTQEQAGNSDQA